MQLSNPMLEKQVKLASSKLCEALIYESAEGAQSRIRGAMAKDDVSILSAEYEHLEKQLNSLVLYSPHDGVFTQYATQHLQDRYARSGDLLGYVSAPDDQPIVRAVVKQQDAGHLGNSLQHAHVKLASNLREEIPVQLVREFPAATVQLPSAALGFSGGGVVYTNPEDPTGRTSNDEVFQLEFSLPVGAKLTGMGERVYLKINHGKEAIWRRLVHRGDTIRKGEIVATLESDAEIAALRLATIRAKSTAEVRGCS